MYSLSVYSTLRILTLYMLGTKKHTLLILSATDQPIANQTVHIRNYTIIE